MLQAKIICKAVRTRLHSRPVVIQGIRQPTLRYLLSPLDVEVNRVPLRLPVGAVICLIANGVQGPMGSLETEVEFLGADGKTHRATQGMTLVVPTPEYAREIKLSDFA